MHHSTILSQLLKLVLRHEFEALAKRHRKGRRLRSMPRWAQFVALALGQLSGRCGLRDVAAGLAAQPKRLHHLGVGRVARSSLSRANSEQPRELCEELFGRLPSRCQGEGARARPPVWEQAALPGFRQLTCAFRCSPGRASGGRRSR